MKIPFIIASKWILGNKSKKICGFVLEPNAYYLRVCFDLDFGFITTKNGLEHVNEKWSPRKLWITYYPSYLHLHSFKIRSSSLSVYLKQFKWQWVLTKQESTHLFSEFSQFPSLWLSHHHLSAHLLAPV